MVSFVFSLGLASISFALTPSKASLAIHSEVEHSTKGLDSRNISSIASETPTPTTGPSVPWQFRAASEFFVPAAVELRSSNVPEDVAASVAKKLVDGALDHPQYTKLLSEAAQIWATDGFYPVAKDVYSFATDASSAYDEIHTGLSYWSYVSFVRSAVTLFDLSKLETVPTVSLNSYASKDISQKSSFASSAFSSLKADPTGLKALETLQGVVDDYVRDFTHPRAKTNSNILEKILMKALGSF